MISNVNNTPTSSINNKPEIFSSGFIDIVNSGQVKEFLPDIETHGFYHGYSLAWGVDINNFVNIKAIYYKYVKQPEIEYYLPIYQFTFNYSVKK